MLNYLWNLDLLIPYEGKLKTPIWHAHIQVVIYWWKKSVHIITRACYASNWNVGLQICNLIFKSTNNAINWNEVNDMSKNIINECDTKTTHAKKIEPGVQLQSWSVKKHKERMYSTKFSANHKQKIFFKNLCNPWDNQRTINEDWRLTQKCIRLEEECNLTTMDEKGSWRQQTKPKPKIGHLKLRRGLRKLIEESKSCC
jgi:hypothetical protein